MSGTKLWPLSEPCHTMHKESHFTALEGCRALGKVREEKDVRPSGWESGLSLGGTNGSGERPVGTQGAGSGACGVLGWRRPWEDQGRWA